jgi:4-aminobutyrate aminotransferase-like enzyme/Ser/Thr protein kinase RdoA (MazF antagonist)
VTKSLTEPMAIAQMLLEKHWDRLGTLERLPGENLNYRLSMKDGETCVLKITLDTEVMVELEEASIAWLRAAGHPMPESITSVEGTTMIATTIDGERMTARLQTFIAGDRWRDQGSSTGLLGAIGALLARVHESFDTFDHPDTARTHAWDLSEAQQHRESVALIEDPTRRRAIESCLHLHAACALPLLPDCPQGILHGDPNDENILVDDTGVLGLLDLGDCLRGALVQDLAIALAYALQHDDASLEDVAALVSGYDAVRRLEPVEEEVLFPLVLARLATSACIAACRRCKTPDHATWYAHQDTTLAAIERLAPIAPRDAHAFLFSACRTPDTQPPRVETLLEGRDTLLGSSLSVSYKKPLHITMGRGQYLHDSNGRPYLDLVNNVNHVGHAHPHVVDAIATQSAKLNTNTRYLHENILRYAGRITATMPEVLDTCFFVNSGSEANELALRLARSATGAHDALVIDGAYHGNTGNSVAMSPYKFDGPGGSGAPEWVHVVPVPDAYRGEIRGNDAEIGSAYALELARVIGEACARGRSIAGFFAEPILSCGGQVPLPAGYLAAAFEHVRKAGGICVADEVQVGFGRVGDTFWGFQLHDVVPDIVVMGKPIGNGHPMGAVVTTRAIADSFDNGMEFFSTFGGNPVSCACGLAVLDIIEKESLQKRARKLGVHFLEGLRALQEKHSIIGDVRGRGLFLGIEFVRDRETLEPADKEACGIVDAMRERGVLLSTDGPLHNVIKIKPPMVLDENDIDMAVRLLDDVLSGMA